MGVFYKKFMATSLGFGRICRLALASTTGLVLAALQGGPAQAALVTTSFVWNGIGTPGSSSYQINGVFTYDDALSTATITPTGNVYDSTATGFTNFVINSVLVAGNPIAGLANTVVVNGAGMVVNVCSTGCSLANELTFYTATQTFAVDPLQQYLGVETATSNLQYGESPAGTFNLVLGGGEFTGAAVSSTGLTVQPISNVPGPLPIVGASMAWGMSRRLRKRVKFSLTERRFRSIS